MCKHGIILQRCLQVFFFKFFVIGQIDRLIALFLFGLLCGNGRQDFAGRLWCTCFDKTCGKVSFSMELMRPETQNAG